MAVSYHCPTENGKFHKTERFSLDVERLTPTEFQGYLGRGRGRTPENLEREVAKRVLKQVEAALAVYDLQSKSNYTRQELISNLELIKRGYQL
jgi:hypothetical protein